MRISSILGRRPISQSLYQSIGSSLKSTRIHLPGGNSVREIFERSLKAAIRDINDHPRGELFRRFIEYGPEYPPDPSTNNGKSFSTDECRSMINFIYSFMVNRFKGDLAELFSIEPILDTIDEFIKKGSLPDDVQFFFGETVWERVCKKGNDQTYGAFAKGADGLIVCTSSGEANAKCVSIKGIVEVKSSCLTNSDILEQIRKHAARMQGGLRLSSEVFAPDQIAVDEPKYIRFIVIPSRWKLDRRWRRLKTETGSYLDFSELDEAPVPYKVEQIDRRTIKVTLAWSEEALSQAAYEMTYWYMTEVGQHIYSKRPPPKGWEEMSAREIGYNAAKNMLYYFPFLELPPKTQSKAIKIYNVYGFGYPNAVDSPQEMLWPEDFTSYQITNTVLDKLKSDGIPDQLTQRLVPLLGKSFLGGTSFRKQLTGMIGEEDMKACRAKIMKHAEFFPDVE